MRKRFEQQYLLGQIPIEEVEITIKNPTPLDELLAALKEIYCNKEYSEEIFNILNKHINANKKDTGRKGMNLWNIFVLSQVRLCLNTNYTMLCNLANNHRTMREIMGVEREAGFERIKFEYQNIYDNVNLLSDELLKEINKVIVSFGHREVFKKKEKAALHLKTDSFVVESNVHFPTDYNLLWDSARKVLDTVDKILKRHKHIKGWRKIKDWRRDLKGMMRELGKASKSGGLKKQERVEKAAKRYLKKNHALLRKLKEFFSDFPTTSTTDQLLTISLMHFMELMEKHIDLVERRIIKGEKIPHEEKLFSIFETYTEWISKGKSHPSVELGKKLTITTDQYDLIIDYRLMHNQEDRDIVIELADDTLKEHNVISWSFDRGYWGKKNKELLQLRVSKVIMPKLGKRNKSEEQEETAPTYKRLKNKHSAIESNINELEHRGLNRCPDKGLAHFSRYVGLGVCAYNLKKIGSQIIKQEQQKREKEKRKSKKAA